MYPHLPCKIPGLSLIYDDESKVEKSKQLSTNASSSNFVKEDQIPSNLSIDNINTPQGDPIDKNNLNTNTENNLPNIVNFQNISSANSGEIKQKDNEILFSSTEDINQHKENYQDENKIDLLDVALANPKDCVVPSSGLLMPKEEFISNEEVGIPATNSSEKSNVKIADEIAEVTHSNSSIGKSSADLSSDSSSDSESNTSFSETDVEEEKAEEKSDAESMAPSTPPKTVNELPEQIYEKPEIVLQPNSLIEPLGKIIQVLKREVVVKSDIDDEKIVFDEKTVLCFEDRSIIGYIHETFGPVSSPYYIVRFSTEEECSAINACMGRPVFYVPTMANKIDPEPLKYIKGSDASNVYDEEINPSEQEFSDDEAEVAAKQLKKKRKRKAKSMVSGNQALPAEANFQSLNQNNVRNYPFYQTNQGSNPPAKRFTQEPPSSSLYSLSESSINYSTQSPMYYNYNYPQPSFPPFHPIYNDSIGYYSQANPQMYYANQVSAPPPQGSFDPNSKFYRNSSDSYRK